jgi:hypothetical protein
MVLSLRLEEGHAGPPSRRDRGDHDVDPGGPFEGERLGQVGDRGLARGVGRSAAEPDHPEGGAHVDDPAAPLLQHHLAHGLTAEEQGLQVHIQDEVPILLRHLLGGFVDVHAGDVGQDVDPSHRLDHIFDHPVDVRRLDQIDVQNQALTLLGLNLSLEFLQTLVVDVHATMSAPYWAPRAISRPIPERRR